MASVIVGHPDSGFSGYLRAAGRGLFFSGGFTEPVDLTTAQETALTSTGFTVDGEPTPPVPDPFPQYLTEAKAATAIGGTGPLGAAGRAAFLRVVGPSNGTGDSAAINAALTAAGAAGRGTVKLLPGQSYVVDAPIVLPSNTVLDISGAGLVRKATHTGHLLTNSAALPMRTTADAATTSGSSTLTSATGAFTGADVGRAVTVVGAGLPYEAEPQDLYATIVSVTNGTTAVLSVAAPTAVTGATLHVYGRDKNIGIMADAASVIDAGDVQGWTYVNYFRRIDGLSIKGNGGTCRAYNGGGVVFWSVGDITNYVWDDWVFAHPAGTTPGPGGTQLCGPMAKFSVTNAKGTLQDDMVALQGSGRGWDWPGYRTNGVQGDLTDGYIGKLFPVDCRSSAVKIFGGITNANVDTKIRGVTVDGVHGGVLLYGVTIESDRSGPTNVDDIKIRDIRVTTGPTGMPIEVRVSSLVAGSVSIDGVSWTGASGTSGAPRSMIGVAGGLKHLDISKLSLMAGDYVDLVHVQGDSADIHTVTLDDAYVASGTIGTNIVHVGNGTFQPAKISNLHLSRLHAYGTGRALLNEGAVATITSPQSAMRLLPSSIDGLTAWYKADAITGLANGAAVASWVDSSAGGRILTQATGANQPTYVTGAQNGLPAVQFDGSNDVLIAPSGVEIGHIFVVAKYNAATFSSYAGLVSSSSVVTNSAVMVGNSGTSLIDTVGPQGAHYYSDGVEYPGDVNLPGPMNKYTITEISWTGWANPLTLSVGQDRGLASRYWNGPICEIVVFNKPLTHAGRQCIETYLQNKWATEMIASF